jgi:hypothetical protein
MVKQPKNDDGFIMRGKWSRKWREGEKGAKVDFITDPRNTENLLVYLLFGVSWFPLQLFVKFESWEEKMVLKLRGTKGIGVLKLQPEILVGQIGVCMDCSLNFQSWFSARQSWFPILLSS